MFAQRKVRAGVLAGTSLLTAVAMLSTASPALAETANSAAAKSASVVERATGTGDLALSTGTPDSAGRAITSTESGSVTVTAPTDSLGYVESTAGDGTKFRLDLPETKKVNGVKAGAGTIVYEDAAESTDLAVQPTADGGARTLVTLKDKAAPNEYRFGLDLPSGTELLEDGQGGYLITRTGSNGAVVVGSIDAPWAKDATGKAVPTAYRIEGGSLVQKVTTTDATAFPVVADPKVSVGWNVYIKFSKAEVKALKSKVAHADTSVAMCGLLVNPVASVGCAVLGGTVIKKIQGVWAYAAAHGRCVELKLTYTGMFGDVKHYKC
ncbi:hypothetical protein ACF063_33540 [Streptomyces chartreusis]|uniref:hypothetical protein n=1 Tax=Streptomyces TaxID=1883 RepID=UPI000F735484|nr:MULTISPECIES: hypothetical protein [Streptomyces]MBT1096449.1 hypothetical protein [Streptomyces sp. Tu102]QEV68165.1 hypothetical protein CP983_16750 [Streptomyces chartreusis]RSN86932.1 hypothetical protein DMH26_32475 [Streptomyces sp. WAC 05379]